MGYQKVVVDGVEYKLMPKWYKEYLSACELMKKAKETDAKELDKSELVRVSYAGKDKTLTDSFISMISAV